MTDDNEEIKGIVAIASYKHREGNILQAVDIFYDRDHYMFFGHHRDNFKINNFEEASCQQELEEELNAFLKPISRKGSGFKKRYVRFIEAVMEALKEAEPSTVHINHNGKHY